ncbi:Olfactomedin-like protein 3A [Bagarius yarrelli]|uniref:Olfactomedin-like protein 3A n=1 Tax=Bagarius yarrelli TaxID=175774 RepID=A0A556V3X2_BAGYA|nr:Olfactomedin-like protein 3A [Bagarius yarrelli]
MENGEKKRKTMAIPDVLGSSYLACFNIPVKDRVSLWHEQTSRYTSELRELKQQIVAQLEGLDKNKETLRTELDVMGARVERVEREMDYLETHNGAPPCMDVDEKMVEHQATVAKEMKPKYVKLTDCSDMVSSIKGMKILKKVGGVKGMWTKDMGASNGKVYLFNGTGEDVLYEFSSVRDFTSSLGITAGKAVQLSSTWQGMGHAVYKNHLYYVKVNEEVRLIKFDLQKGSVAGSAVFPDNDQLPVYSLNSETYIDLAVDEEGLWAIYARKNNEKHVSLAKVHPKTLAIEQIWDTSCPRENAEAAFVVCGVVYVVYNSKLPSRSRIQCVFDVTDMVTNDDVPTVYFPKRYGTHSSLKYSPIEQLVYAWDNGYQILYKLQMKKKIGDAEIIRTRDPVELDKCDVVVDVGGVYDHHQRRYDHHQRSFKETFNSLCPEKPWVTKLSSAGLVYLHYGRRILSQLTNLAQESSQLEILFDKMYENFLEEVDAVDNGISQYDGDARYTVSTTLSTRVSHLNPWWNGDCQKTEVDASGEIISLTHGGCPWKEHLFLLEKEYKVDTPIKFVLYPDQNEQWRVQCVPTGLNTFQNRLSLLEEWRGIRDNALSQISGIPECVFVHASGFIGGNKTEMGVLEMARKTLQASNSPGNKATGS